jgi:hypothetical protein
MCRKTVPQRVKSAGGSSGHKWRSNSCCVCPLRLDMEDKRTRPSWGLVRGCAFRSGFQRRGFNNASIGSSRQTTPSARRVGARDWPIGSLSESSGLPGLIQERRRTAAAPRDRVCAAAWSPERALRNSAYLEPRPVQRTLKPSSLSIVDVSAPSEFTARRERIARTRRGELRWLAGRSRWTTTGC